LAGIDKERVMANAPGKVAYVGEEPFFQASIEVEVKGATLRNETNDSVTIRLDGLSVAEPNWEAIQQIMLAAGIEKADVNYLVEQFAEQSFTFLLAKALAERCRRVG
jgi:hypothetical protein